MRRGSGARETSLDDNRRVDEVPADNSDDNSADEMNSLVRVRLKQQLQQHVDGDRLSSQTDVTSHPVPSSSSSSSSLQAADADGGDLYCLSSMATHRMPATLPLATSKQHPQRQHSAELVGRSQSVNNNDTL